MIPESAPKRNTPEEISYPEFRVPKDIQKDLAYIIADKMSKYNGATRLPLSPGFGWSDRQEQLVDQIVNPNGRIVGRTGSQAKALTLKIIDGSAKLTRPQIRNLRQRIKAYITKEWDKFRDAAWKKRKRIQDIGPDREKDQRWQHMSDAEFESKIESFLGSNYNYIVADLYGDDDAKDEWEGEMYHNWWSLGLGYNILPEDDLDWPAYR